MDPSTRTPREMYGGAGVEMSNPLLTPILAAAVPPTLSTIIKPLLVGAALLLLAALVGHKIGHWRAVADAAEAADKSARIILQQTETIGELRLQIADQNKSIEVAHAQAEGARQAQAEAQRRAEDASQVSQSRVNKIDKALEGAKTAGDLLARYWEIRQ